MTGPAGRILEYIEAYEAVPEGRPLIVALDGRCASGKTSVSAELQEARGYCIFHMDDFYLRPEQRTPDRFSVPGANVDHERFLSEILIPLKNGAGRIIYRAYDCRSGSFREPAAIVPGSVVLIEGSYSCHPSLRDYYDLHFFLTVSKAEQEKRIFLRNGSKGLDVFKTRWIPLEEEYFEAYRVPEQCDLLIETG